jgi:hypothetical protein
MCGGLGRLEDPEDDGGEEIESGEKPEVLDDGVGGVRHDVRVDGDGGELLPGARAEEAEVEARLGRTAGALQEAEDDLLGGELRGGGGRGAVGSNGK